MKQSLTTAVKSHYIAQRDEAAATLDVYFCSSAGIGEHPQVVEEMVKQVEKYSSACDSLEKFEEYMKNSHAFRR